ncbi:MAG: isoprenyl transferase [Phycisphaerales bacterium]|nr:isoprenyl transferase [Phycisphaerales bacterium]
MSSKSPIDLTITMGLQPAQLPPHVAIIMDGNGRWAQQRGKPRILGHHEGARAVRRVTTTCARLGIDTLTLYSFSLENWKRPRDEVDGLMSLYVENLIAERGEIMDNNIRLMQIGRREGLPDAVIRELSRTEELSRGNTGMRLCLALNYGSRAEIVDAVRTIAERVRIGEMRSEDIDENTIDDALYTRGLPDPDFVIRTAGEMRLSNFLLWQVSYAEFYATPVLWPDFTETDLFDALRAFAVRERRFGDVASAANAAAGSGA